MSTVQTFPNAARPQRLGPAWTPAGGLRVIRDPEAGFVSNRVVATAANLSRDGAG